MTLALVSDNTQALANPKPRKPVYTHRLKNVEKAMNVLRYEMYEWHAQDLADAVGVSRSCIEAIRSGRTTWPRHKTFFGLLEALDLDMYLVKREK